VKEGSAVSSVRMDHVVVRVESLERAVEDYRALGFTVTPGGRHPAWGSENALVVFDDGAYIELIAFDEPIAEGVRRDVHARLLAEGRSRLEARVLSWSTAPPGLVDFAVAPVDMDAFLGAAAARGVQLEGPTDGSRTRPDGERVAWQMAIPETLDVPFVCADVTDRDLRVPVGDARRHRNGASGLPRVCVVSADADGALARLSSLLGVRAGGGGVLCGACRFEVTDPEDEPEAAAHLGECGPGPWRVQLRAAPVGAPSLDRTRAHGARVEMVAASR